MAYGEIDETRGGLRLLIMMYDYETTMMGDSKTAKKYKGMIQTELHEEMKKRYHLGRRVVDSALTVLKKYKLVKRETRRVGSNPMPSLFHSLTPQGKKIASILMELESALV